MFLSKSWTDFTYYIVCDVYTFPQDARFIYELNVTNGKSLGLFRLGVETSRYNLVTIQERSKAPCYERGVFDTHTNIWFSTQARYIRQRFLDAKTKLPRKEIQACAKTCYKILAAKQVKINPDLTGLEQMCSQDRANQKEIT